MISRETRMRVAKLAGKVLLASNARTRILEGGYTRIDPITIAEAHGVWVMTRPLDRLLGAFLREERPGILLNSQRPVGMVHMTCAHELGHFFLGHKTTADEHLDYGGGGDPTEQEADQFAYSLMTPGWLIAHVLRQHQWATRLNEPAVVYQLSLRLGLSYEATARALEQQEKLSAIQLNRLLAVKPMEIKRALVPAGVEVSRNEDVWLLTQADGATVLEPRPEDHVFISLPSHAAAGFLWSSHGTGEGFTLKPVPAPAQQAPQDLGKLIVGGKAHAVYELRMGTDGRRAPVKVELAEQQPWNPQAPVADQLNLFARFEGVEEGLTQGSVQLQLKEFAS